MTDMNPSPAPSGASAAAEKPAVAGRLLGAADIRHIAAEAGISPTKKFGQNFVIDPGTVRRIVREAAVTADTRVLEVGPGLGSLTLAILETGATMTAVEIDPPVAQRLPHTIDTYMPDARNRLIVGSISIICQQIIHHCLHFLIRYKGSLDTCRLLVACRIEEHITLSQELFCSIHIDNGP